MNISSIIQESLKLIPYKTDFRVGGGADGIVYELFDDENKVIKISVLFDYKFENNLHKVYNAITEVYEHIKKHKPKNYVTIYDYGLVLRGERIFANKKQSYIVHFCVMEKLEKLTKEDMKFLDNKNFQDDDIENRDYHIRNIMKDRFGNYKIIDLDRCRMIGNNF